MSEQFSGVVQKVNTTFSPATAARKWSKKSFLINDEWYGTFINSDNRTALEAVGEGDAVKVTYEQKGEYKNLVSIETIARSESEGKPTQTTSVVSTSVKPFNPVEKDFRITYLACRRDALEFVKTAIQLGVFDLEKVKKADKESIFYDLVNKYAMLFTMKSWKIQPEEDITYTDKAVTAETKKAVNE